MTLTSPESEVAFVACLSLDGVAEQSFLPRETTRHTNLFSRSPDQSQVRCWGASKPFGTGPTLTTGDAAPREPSTRVKWSI